MPKIQVNDVHLYYESFGSGVPLVFVSGFAGDHFGFQGMLEYFTSDYQVIVFDNRGSGQSDCPDSPYRIDMMADDVAALCQALQLPAGYFFGVSMGGAIVQMLARNHPHLVRKAVLCNTFSKVDIRFTLTAKAQLEFMQKGCSTEALWSNVMGWIYSSAFLEQPGTIETVTQLVLSNPFPMTEIGYRNQLAAVLNFDSSAWLAEIQAPCLVIGSDKDIIIDEQHMQSLAKAIPNAHYQGIPGTGHVPFWERPEEVCRVVKDFLA